VRPESGLVAAPDGPAGAGHLSGLVEQTALGAGEGDLLVGAHPAPLEFLLVSGGLHDVMTAILVHGHIPLCPIDAAWGWQRVASQAWHLLPPKNN
jgi:hypothetical protein